MLLKFNFADESTWDLVKRLASIQLSGVRDSFIALIFLFKTQTSSTTAQYNSQQGGGPQDSTYPY